jgi:hypothetical protein
VTLAALSGWVPQANARATAESQIVRIRFGVCRVEVNRVVSVAVRVIGFFTMYLLCALIVCPSVSHSAKPPVKTIIDAENIFSLLESTLSSRICNCFQLFQLLPTAPN